MSGEDAPGGAGTSTVRIAWPSKMNGRMKTQREDSVLATVEEHGQVEAVAQERGADETVDNAAAGVQFGGHQRQNDHADSADEQRCHIEAEHVFLPSRADRKR